MTDTATVVSIGPLYQLAEPYLNDLFIYVFIPVLLGWVSYLLQKYTNIKVSDSANARVQAAAQNAAGRILASLEPAAMSAKIDVHSQLVANEAPKVIAAVGQSLNALGITPEAVDDSVKHLIAGKVGQLQASIPAAAPEAKQ